MDNSDQLGAARRQEVPRFRSDANKRSREQEQGEKGRLCYRRSGSSYGVARASPESGYNQIGAATADYHRGPLKCHGYNFSAPNESSIIWNPGSKTTSIKRIGSELEVGRQKLPFHSWWTRRGLKLLNDRDRNISTRPFSLLMVLSSLFISLSAMALVCFDLTLALDGSGSFAGKFSK